MLTEIDVRATMRDKLGSDMEDYLILGACNPRLAQRALDMNRQIGLLLPCNVVVRRLGEETVVEALDPGLMVALSGQPELEPVAREARARLAEALQGLLEPSGT